VPLTFFTFTQEELALAPEIIIELTPPHAAAALKAAASPATTSATSATASSNSSSREGSTAKLPAADA